MNYFANIGIFLESEYDYMALYEKVYEIGVAISAGSGYYVVYSDKSGAEVWLQINSNKKMVGIMPHYKGLSRRKVCLTGAFERDDNEFDGAFQCWAEPKDDDKPGSGEYPFVFDIPEFRTINEITFPKNREIQLTAFANELNYFESEQSYLESQTNEIKFSSRSFIPIGLFASQKGDSNHPPEATALISGIIKDYSIHRNTLTGISFLWLLVDTLGGEIDVVSEMEQFSVEPKVGGVIQGQFWLSGQLINQSGMGPWLTF